VFFELLQEGGSVPDHHDETVSISDNRPFIPCSANPYSSKYHLDKYLYPVLAKQYYFPGIVLRERAPQIVPIWLLTK
jgi:hypothetical protein